jgi:hypothetical protein
MEQNYSKKPTPEKFQGELIVKFSQDTHLTKILSGLIILPTKKNNTPCLPNGSIYNKCWLHHVFLVLSFAMKQASHRFKTKKASLSRSFFCFEYNK